MSPTASIPEPPESPESPESPTVSRCGWPGEDELYCAYHDEEWGRPNTEDPALYEKICLEGFQAGLSWITILRKREAFREGFAGFDPELVARFGESEVQALLGNPGIVRHQGKIRSTINNAQRALEIAEEFGSLSKYLWGWAPPVAADERPKSDLPASTPESTALSKDLRKRGWTFVGPTTVYAFMQAVGMVNDHLADCDWYGVCAALPAPNR
jgi:DNA-3-methyladenine glycosylase I